MDIEEYKDELPPIPDGWACLHYTDASLTTTNYKDMGEIKTLISSPRPNKIINHYAIPNMFKPLEVLVLIRSQE